jgi:hypothetical protein
VVGAVGIHDGEALHPRILGPALGDIGDPAVEEGALAGEARIDGVGAFVGGAAPVARGDDIALAGELRLERDIVEVAADGQLPVRIRAHEALDQGSGAGSAPGGISRGRDFGEGHGADSTRADRAEQAAAAKVGGDDFGDLPAQRLGAPGGGVGRLRRRHDGDGDDEIVAAFIGDIDAELGRGGHREREQEEREQALHHCDSLLSKVTRSDFHAS